MESYRIYKRPYSACSHSPDHPLRVTEKATHDKLVGPTLSTARGDKYYNQYRPLCQLCPRDHGKVVETLQGGIYWPTTVSHLDVCWNKTYSRHWRFYAHLQQGQTYIKLTDARGIYFQDMASYHNLVAVNTLPFCTGATASFVSYGDIYESLIDHISTWCCYILWNYWRSCFECI